MMIYPSINELMKNVDSRYALVIATAKRARAIADIQNEDPHAFDCEGYDVTKPVAIAVREIADKRVCFFGNQNKAPTTAKETIISDALRNKSKSN